MRYAIISWSLFWLHFCDCCCQSYVMSEFKVSGPFVETLYVFFCIKNIINAEMWA